MISDLDKEWKDWLEKNLKENTDPVHLYDILRTHGFDIYTIKKLMGNAYPSRGYCGKLPSTINYQAIASILDHTQKPSSSLQRVDTDMVQLYSKTNFLTVKECEQLIELAKIHLTPSQTTHSNGDDYFRTSMTCHLNMHTDPFVKQIDDKISRFLGIKWPYSEPIQIQSYKTGQELKAHHDYFALEPRIYRKAAGKAGQRTWTFTVYLNDVIQGGGTHFLYLDHIFYPKQGTAVIWNNLYPDGVPNRKTLHCGMPVEKGEKFIITKWFREQGFGSMFF